ncbi:DUF333 domain-containing protein [Candidatus Woesearchaeota archaeon]|nr:DUF333 domain-containing protein [Candidatus Woesearchaeota archaeon]
MKRIVLVMVLVAMFCLVIGCRSEPQDYMLSKEEAKQEKVKEQSGLANPASIYCMNQTGTDWSIRENEAGQYGICIFPDGSWCEEWAYYREWCKPGMNLTECGERFWGKTVCPPQYSPVCAKVESDAGVTWETFSNDCTACKASTETEVVVGYVLGRCE